MWRRGLRGSFGVGAFAVVQGVTAIAGASEGDSEAAADPVATEVDPAPRRQWYGWQTLLVDAAAVGFVVVGLRTQSTPVGYTGVLTYLFGGPVVHAAHGRGGATLGSLALRLGVPLATGWILTGGSEDRASDAPGFGVSVGVPLAIALDATVLAWKARPTESELPWRPRVIVRGTEARVEILGSF